MLQLQLFGETQFPFPEQTLELFDKKLKQEVILQS
jgi:hypothetical protein